MSKNTKQVNTRHRVWVILLFHLLLFSYPLLSFLWRRSYSFLSSEVAVMFLVLALISILLAILLKQVRPVIINVLSVVFITMVLMLQFNLLILGSLVFATIGLFLAWRFHSNFQLNCLPVLAILIIGAYFDSYENDGWLHADATPLVDNAELPPVVHILMDGFIGTAGLPDYPVSESLKSEINTFFEDYDFQVFSHAYSRYSNTGDSLYAALNFEHDSWSEFAKEAMDRRKHVLKTNAEFDVMEALGYRLNVYQTGHLNFCQSNPDKLDRCWQYDHPNVKSIGQARGWFFRVTMLTKVLLEQSTLISNLIVSRKWLLDQGIVFHDPRVTENLKADLINGAGGHFYFAHILLPHGPFAYMHDCSINYESPVWARYAALVNEPVVSDEIYEIRVMKYFEQMDCALMNLREIFEAMQMAGIYERSVIVVHGDHGSQIGKYVPKVKNLEQLTTTEYRAYYSTLFAVKIPGHSVNVDHRVLSLGTLLEMFSTAVQDYVEDPQSPLVFMKTVPDDPEKVDTYIYITGSHPQTRVDINIFED